MVVCVAWGIIKGQGTVVARFKGFLVSLNDDFFVRNWKDGVEKFVEIRTVDLFCPCNQSRWIFKMARTFWMDNQLLRSGNAVKKGQPPLHGPNEYGLE